MTMRQCQITGITFDDDSAGIITMNGIEVFNGSFTGELDTYTTIATFDLDVDNALATNYYVTVPTSITVTAGSISVALSEYNYGTTPNPIYTTDQFNVVNNPASSPQSKLEIYNSVVTTPLSSADKTILLSTVPSEQPARHAILVANNLTALIQPEDVFGYAVTDILNRTNVKLDGVEPFHDNTNQGIAVSQDQVLTYDSLIFVTNYYMQT